MTKVFALIILLFVGTITLFAAARTPWTSSKVVGSPEQPKPFVLDRVFANLTFKNPVDLVHEATTDRYFIAELDGRISSFANDNNVKQADLCIDLKQHHPKLLHLYSLVFHPAFKTSRYVYVCYVAERNAPQGTHISRFKVTATDPPQIDPASEQLILTWRSGGHNGCKLLFGRDGMLYISSGDATQPSPPDILKTGQDISDLLSSVMRIDVNRRDGDKHYAIPSDNPFVNHKSARPEVWAYGLRNPWRMSFDAKTGDLWVGDVGWELWELIFRVERGGNYGWSIVEGSQPVRPNGERGPTPIQPPIAQHAHTEAMSITGGYVYRGERLKSLHGQYVYGDYITGKMWALPAKRDVKVSPTEIADTQVQIISFSETPDRDLLILDYAGSIHRLVPNSVKSSAAAFPTKLSETGLFKSVKEHRVAEGVERYNINAPLWSDHASAERFIAVPGDAKIGYFTKNNGYKGWIRGRWEYPTGTVFAKTLSMEMTEGDPSTRRRLETQLLHLDGESWRGYTYVWNAEQSDAELATANGIDFPLEVRDEHAPKGVRQQTWHVASRTECMTCHNPKSGIILGFSPEQLANEKASNELTRLESRALFNLPSKQTAHALVHAKALLPMVNPYDDRNEIRSRARSWLQVNCAHCHQQGGGGSTPIDLRYAVPFAKTKLVETPPMQGDFGIADAKLVSPGDPYRSVLFYRVATTGVGHMPHMGSKLVDTQGVRVIHDWIAQLPGGSPTVVNEKLGVKEVDQLLSSTEGSLRLLHALGAGKIDRELRKYIIERGATHGDVQISGLFQRFVPPAKRRKTLGQNIQPQTVLSLSGDLARGARILQRGAAVTCLSCHTLAGKGRDLGPDLSAIGSKFKRDELLAHILEPSKSVDEKYTSWTVSTLDGDDLTGFIISRNKKKLTMKLQTGASMVIAIDQVDTMRQSKLSAMPTQLLQGLTAQEAADLIDYLASLRKPQE